MSAVNVTNISNSIGAELRKDNTEHSVHTAQQASKTDELEKTIVAENAKKSSENEPKEVVVITPEQLEKVAQQLQDFMGEMNRSLEFLVDKDSGRDVIKVLDKGTGELVKQYPTEEVLTLISKLSDANGHLIDTEI